MQLADRRRHPQHRRRQRPFEMSPPRRAPAAGDTASTSRLHRFGLHQIELAVQERAQRELAWPGWTRAAGRGRGDDRGHHHRAAVRGDLHDVFAGVGRRSREIGDEGVVGHVEAAEPAPGSPGGRAADGCGRRARARCRGAAGPLSRTIATPPCPAGVATATMVSSVANTAASRSRADLRAYLLTEMMTVFSNESPMLSEVTDGSSATAMCTIRRS